MVKPFLFRSRENRRKVYFLKKQSELSHWYSSKVKIFHVVCITGLHSAIFLQWKKITLNKLATECKTMHCGQGHEDFTADGLAARRLSGRNAA